MLVTDLLQRLESQVPGSFTILTLGWFSLMLSGWHSGYHLESLVDGFRLLGFFRRKYTQLHMQVRYKIDINLE